MSYSVLSKGLERIDVVDKVTGYARYTVDMGFPGMLHAKFLRSPYAHAKIRAIDTSAAEKVAGVRAILTHKNVPRILYGLAAPMFVKDEYIFDTKVRFIGDTVAAVAATTVDAAEEAAERIHVDYELLPSVTNPEEAMKPGAPLIHEEITKNNVCDVKTLRVGDVEKGLKEADLVVGPEVYETHIVHNMMMEPYAVIASWNPFTNKVQLHLSTAAPYLERGIIAEALGVPLSNIRILVPPVGGSFGSKTDGLQGLQPAACLLSKATGGKPVKMVATREECMIGKNALRHPSKSEVITGVMRDGTFLAMKMKSIVDMGAYAGQGPAVVFAMLAYWSSLYRCPNVLFEGYSVYTNKTPQGAMRGFGNPQQAFAREQHIDVIAEELKMDPMELRLKNFVRKGDVTNAGLKIRSCGISECVEKAAKEIEWQGKGGRTRGLGTKRRGIGMGCCIHASGYRGGTGYDTAGAFVNVMEDGTVTLMVGCCDSGQGAKTALAMIAAETLGIPLADVRVADIDTDIAPFDMGAHSSSTTFRGGNAVKLAAEDVRCQVFEQAAEMMESNVADLECEEGRIRVKVDPSRFVTFKDAVKTALSKKAGPGRGQIIGKGTYDAPDELPDAKTLRGAWTSAVIFNCQFAEVEVDVETGQVEIVKIVTAHDCGRAINPVEAEAQLEGALQMGLGFSLVEQCSWDGTGKPLIRDFVDYKTFYAPDMPETKIILVESFDPLGPYGAKGLGEPGTIATAPAIANAIYNATGVRIRELPMTPEKLLEALEKHRNSMK